jgi:hypothetical protein
MANLVLGSYTFEWNPSGMSPIKSSREISAVKTFSSVEVFSWGLMLPGTECILEWELMTKTMWNNLVTLEALDAVQVFNPQNGHTYNVQIMSLTGMESNKHSGSDGFIENVVMHIVIESEAS